MNDDFLYQSRPPVREEFAAELSRKLAMEYPERATEKRPALGIARPWLRLGVWRSALLAFTLVTALALTISEPARAKAWEWIREIAGYAVEERATLPQSDPAQATVYVIPTVSAADALKNPPFPFKLPAWAPEGFKLNDYAAISRIKDRVSLSWSNSDDDRIEMLVEREYGGECIVAGENSSQEIQVGCTPALLVQGNWDLQGQWDAQSELTIYWMNDGHGYRLIYKKGNPQNNIPQPIAEAEREAILGDLVKMAGSISP